MEAFLHKVKRLVNNLFAKGTKLLAKLNEANISIKSLFSSLLDRTTRLDCN